MTGSKRKGSTTAEGEEKKPRKVLYFEFAKKKWENEDSFKLPDGAPFFYRPTHAVLVCGIRYAVHAAFVDCNIMVSSNSSGDQ